jgi:hypothetical protein
MTQVFQIEVGQPKNTSLAVDADYNRKYTSEYQIYTERETSPENVRLMSGLPQYGSVYNWYGFVDDWAFCRDIQVSRKAEIKDPNTADIRTLWRVKVIHDSKPTGGSNDFQGRNNPLDDPIVISGGFGVFKQEVSTDRFENPIVNAAGDPYNPSPEIDEAVDTLSMSYNTATLNLQLRAEMIGKVNANIMWGLEPRRVKLTQWNYQVLRSGPNFEYIKHDFEFQVSFKLHPTEANLVARGPVGVRGYYHTLPNAGELFFKEDNPQEIPGSDPPQTTNRYEENIGKWEVDDEPINVKGMLEPNGTKRASGPMLYNVFEVDEQIDFSLIPKMPTASLPGPFA